MEAEKALQQVMVAPSLSKATQQNIAQDLVAKVVDGSVDPMQAFIQVKAVAEVCDMFLKNEDIVNRTMFSVTRCGNDLPQFNGAKVALTSSTRYDYETSQDPEYIALLTKKKDIETKLKAREMFLKALDDSVDIVDRETGEVRTILPPTKKQSQTLRVTFAKQ